MRAKNSGVFSKQGFSLIELLTVILVIAILAGILIPVVGSVRERAKASNCQTNLRQIGTLVSLYINENGGRYPGWRTWTDGTGSWVWDNYSRGLRADGSVIGGVLPRMAGYYDGGGMTEDQYRAQGSKHLFNCPANEGARALGYAANMNVMREPDRTIGGEFEEATTYRAINLPNPGRVIMIADNSMETRSERWLGLGNWEGVMGFHRHGGKANVLYADFGVGAVSRDEVSEKNIDPEWE